MQMAQQRSWVQTPAALWPRHISTVPTAPGNLQNPMWVTPVQHASSVVQPVKPRWIYASPLRQQRSALQMHDQSVQGVQNVRSVPSQNVAPNVVAVKVGAPQLRKDTQLIDGRVPTVSGVETMKPSEFKRMWDQNHQSMVVVDLRGEDRASGKIAGSLPIPALDFLKDLQQWCAKFEGKPMVCFFCQYSLHRAPTVANHFRKNCQPTQRVLVMDGGFRGWEAQKLPVENQSPELSQAAYDNLALKMGRDLLSKV